MYLDPTRTSQSTWIWSDRVHLFRITFVLFLLICSVTVTIRGQAFKGTVLDHTNDQPIAFANVFFAELETGTVTNGEGIFFIEHPPHKAIHIQISFIGYKAIDEIVDLDAVREKIFYLEPAHIALEEIVVSAPIGKLQRDNVVSVERIRMDQLMGSNHLTLSDALSVVPGVEQNTTGAGIGKPVIRGLSGNRIITYAQGIRVENQQWGDEHGLGIGEVGIESVEIIKGPASLLYGSDALGGVLYFVDERYANHNTVAGFFRTRFLTNSLGTLNNLGLKLHKDNLKFNLFGTLSSIADYRIPGLVRVFNTRFNEKDIKASFGFNKNNWISNLRYSFLQNNYGITDTALYVTSVDRKFILPFQTIDNHSLSFENTLITGESRFKLIMGFSNNIRQEFEDAPSEAALNMKLQTFTYDAKWHSPTFNKKLKLIAGVQGMFQTNKNAGTEILIPDASTFDLGGLIIANYTNNNIQLEAGLRGDYRLIDTEGRMEPGGDFPALHRSFGNLNYSGGAVYTMGDSKIRANISSGFRAPNTSELLSNGIHEGTNRYEIGNPDLNSENATQMDLSFDYQNDHFSFGINPFYNIIQNYIFLSPTDSTIDNSPVFEYLQTKASLFGGELGIHYHPHAIHWLHLESELSSVFAEGEQNNPLPLIPATKIVSSLKAVFTQPGKVRIKDIFVQYIYRFKQDRVGQFESPSSDYHLLNIGANWEILTKSSPIEINTGVMNVLNTEYIDHLSRFKTLGIPNPGINFYIGLKIAFDTELVERG